MYYVYVVKLPDRTLYIGYSADLQTRIKRHRKERGIKGLVYYEAYQDKQDALERERQLKKYKSSWGHLKKRIRRSIQSV